LVHCDLHTSVCLWEVWGIMGGRANFARNRSHLHDSSRGQLVLLWEPVNIIQSILCTRRSVWGKGE
jgi:hypothetical protein